MRRSSRISLLFVAALVVSAFSAQSASAYWTQEGNPIEESAEISLDGAWQVYTPAAEFGWACDDVTGDVTLNAEAEGTLGSAAMSFEDCRGLGKAGGLYAEVSLAKPAWAIEGKEGAIRFSPGTSDVMTIAFKSGGENGQVVQTMKCDVYSLVLTPDNQAAIQELQGNAGLLCNGTWPLSAETEFDVSPAGVYSWE